MITEIFNILTGKIILTIMDDFPYHKDDCIELKVKNKSTTYIITQVNVCYKEVDEFDIFKFQKTSRTLFVKPID